MGITFAVIEQMQEKGLLKAGCSVLDIGSSNLYSADEAQIIRFLDRYAPGLTGRDDFARRMATGSGYDPVKGGANGSFVGELFESAGMPYQSIDIADGYNTLILDLNRAVLPPDLRAKFDLVLNFGTTEHILNQFNCFEVMHDAIRIGGHIFHSLPAVGYVDHGYVTYTGRCFFDIAGYNEYEIVDFWFEGPAGSNNLYESLRSYRSYFPALDRALGEIGKTTRATELDKLGVPDVSINVIYRKVKDKPFWGALEASTSVGHIPGQVTDHYAGETGVSAIELREPPVLNVSQRPREVRGGAVRCVSDALRRFPVLHSALRSIYRTIARMAR